jgi:hypothetical protein
MNAPLRTSANVSLPLLTHSSMSAARACLRLYRNKYVLRIRPLQHRDDAPELGDLVHVGLEAWWLKAGDSVQIAIRAARSYAEANKVDASTSSRRPRRS